VIKVKGKGECSHAGYKVRLELTNEGVWDDPEVAALALVVEEEEVGAEVMTPFVVEEEIKGDPAVRIRIDIHDGSEWSMSKSCD
jgi:hypothetical protein